MKYEDLWNDAVLELRKICDYLDYSCEQSLLEQAARLFSFEQLSGGRQPGDENKHHFFRKGVVGDYKNYFGPIDKWLMLRWAREQMTALGYIE